MRLALTCAIGLVTLVACAVQPSSREWTRHDIDLSGKRISISAPRGDIGDKNVASAALGQDAVLFSRAWIFSSAGAIDARLVLHRLKERSSGDFFASVRREVLSEVRRPFPKADIVNIRTRSMGGTDWTCYVVTMLRASECVLEVDSESYLSWRAEWIANSQLAIPAEAKGMVDKVESSIEVAF